MKNQIVTLPFPAAGALHQCKPSPFLHLAALRAFRRLRISLPRRAPRPLCGELRAIRTARESAEIAVWQSNGGNTLRRFRLRLR